MRKTVEVQMDAGMEARPIALMVQTANQFSSHLYPVSYTHLTLPTKLEV